MWSVQNTLFICIDMQEKLLPLMFQSEQITKNTNILLESAKLLGVKTLLTEQYPKGLGSTDSSILHIDSVPKLEKSSFSIFGDDACKQWVAQSGAKHLVLFGIESHICVLQSALDALQSGYDCTLVVDACSSRNMLNHANTAAHLHAKGVNVLPTESVLFFLLKDCAHPQFKAISKLIK